jgi:arabinan endo-1,5-alpha-L-arabinosidase
MVTLHQPVYGNYFADPFAWKHNREYYAVGTGPVIPSDHASAQDMTSTKIDGQEFAFPILHSKDFWNWKSIGGALRVPSALKGGEFWAPETAYDGKFFYLYYSVNMHGEELKHRLRVARSTNPGGPYDDVGYLMERPEDCYFAIDAHAFRDDDGQWYLFYARDFVDTNDGYRAGTGLVVDRLIDMTKLAGEERVVMRSRCDWQLFKSNRYMPMYNGKFDWHTLEGPCVCKHDGRYYCFYSGGCYENETYGVDYGVADNVLGPYESIDCEIGARVMKTNPELIGPGHISVVPGPDDKTEYVAFHAWDHDMKARQFHLGKLLWTPEGPRVDLND